MPILSDTITCPACGVDGLPLLRTGARLVAIHACRGLPAREVFETDADPASDPLAMLPGVNREIAGALHAIGLHTVSDVAAASDETLLAVPGIGRGSLKKIRAYVPEKE